jgi:hypothetical protein
MTSGFTIGQAAAFAGVTQPAQPRARHVGEDAFVRANLERPKHPDPHPADSAMGDWQACDR